MKKRTSSPRRWATISGILLSATVLVSLTSPQQEQWLSPGGTGDDHRSQRCEVCHVAAPGTARQQVQANVRSWIGLREEGVAFGTIPVSNQDCLDCHRNPIDPHATHLFLEPRYQEIRESLAPHLCISCHDEHSGEIVSISADYCIQCHHDLEIAGDRSIPSHESLIKAARWDSCLQCHDYHKNHFGEYPSTLEEASSPQSVLDYLAGETPAPYPDLIHQYLEERDVPR